MANLNILISHLSTKTKLAKTSSVPRWLSNILLSARMREINANVIAVAPTSNKNQEEKSRETKKDQERKRSLTQLAYRTIGDSVAVVYGRPIGRSIAPLEPTPPTKSPLPSTTATSHERTPRRVVDGRDQVRGASSERTQRAPSKINRPMATGTRA